MARGRSWKELRAALSTAPLLDASVAAFVWPIVAYLALFSLLPHKELRFIFNAIPILNMAAAVVRRVFRRCRADGLNILMLCLMLCTLTRVLPSCTALAARYVQPAVQRWRKRQCCGADCCRCLQSILPLLGAIGCVLVTTLGATFFFMASRVNYPGSYGLCVWWRHASFRSTDSRFTNCQAEKRSSSCTSSRITRAPWRGRCTSTSRPR